ncbi:MAG: LamG domain-containing protein, partial [bacterium]|nr:LamG domain-containing protein [bacterium]
NLTFTNPTESNETTIYTNWTQINITIADSDLASFDFDWQYVEKDEYLIGWWRLEKENGTFFIDESSYKNNGTCLGSTCPAVTTGMRGKAYDFDGDDDYVDCDNSGNLNILVDQGLTIEAWIKTESNQEGGVATKFPASGDTPGYYTHVKNTGIPGGWIGDNSETSTPNWNFGSTTVNDGAWHHIVWVRSRNGSNKLYGYVDGMLKGEADDTTVSGLNNTGVLLIGDRSLATHRYFNGTIDEVRVYNTSLSADDVKQRYLSTRARYFDDSLVLAMNFNNNSAIGETATFAVDSSNDQRNGIINDAIWTENGVYGGAMSFDGDDDYVQTNSTTSAIPMDSSFTIMSWVKVNNEHTARNIYFDQGIYFEFTQSERFYWWGDMVGTGSININGQSSVYNYDTWYHVAYIYDREAENSYIYVDGALDDETAAAGDLNSVYYRNLTIGKRVQDPYYLNGSIDELRVYTRALSADEILRQYQS